MTSSYHRDDSAATGRARRILVEEVPMRSKKARPLPPLAEAALRLVVGGVDGTATLPACDSKGKDAGY